MPSTRRPLVILADVNILVSAFDEEARAHERYRAWLVEALSGSRPFALVDPVLTGFLRVVTSSRIYERPTDAADALAFVQVLTHAPSAVWIDSNDSVWQRLSTLIDQDRGLHGNRIPDAYLAALAIVNGAQLATADRGFARYPGLRWFDPAAASDA